MLQDLNNKQSLKTFRLKWNDPHTYSKYGLFYFLFILSFIPFAIFKRYIHEPISGFEKTVGIVLLAFIVILIFLSIRALLLNERLIQFPMTPEAQIVRKFIEDYLKKDGYIINRANDNYLIAKNGKWFVGSAVVIIFSKKSLYINVQNNYGFRGYFPFSFGQNKRIMTRIVSHVIQLPTMPKSILTDTEQVTQHIQKLDQAIRDVVETLRQIILNTDAEIAEQIKWNNPGFYYAGEMAPFDPKQYKRDMIVMNLHKNRIMLVFPSGAKVNDTSGLLTGDYKDGRRLAIFKDIDDVQAKTAALQNVIRKWLALVER